MLNTFNHSPSEHIHPLIYRFFASPKNQYFHHQLTKLHLTKWTTFIHILANKVSIPELQNCRGENTWLSNEIETLLAQHLWKKFTKLIATLIKFGKKYVESNPNFSHHKDGIDNSVSSHMNIVHIFMIYIVFAHQNSVKLPHFDSVDISHTKEFVYSS